MDESTLLATDNEEEEERDSEIEKQAEDIRKDFFRLGITQLVFGVLLLCLGVVISCTWPDRGVDRSGEGIWCGTLVLMCGAITITARFHLYKGVVICSLALNILTAVLLSAGIFTSGWSTFSHVKYDMSDMAKFIPQNCILIACIVLSIYLAIIFGNVLSQNRETACCFGNYQSMGYPGYTMAYIPPGTHNAAVGAYMAVPGKAAQPQQNAA